MNHFLLINKPPGITSFSVVKKVRNITKIEKVGHMGTLDPRACGLIIIGLDKGVKLTEYFINLDKTYITEVIFGIESETYDRECSYFQYKNSEVQEEDLKKVLESLIGEREQIPPSYSAAHFQGEKSYKLARKGIKVELPKRKIKVYESRLIYFKKNKYPKALIEFRVSSGTYIRSLVKELGEKLNTYAITSFLLRTQIGKLHLNNAIMFKNLEREWRERLIPAKEVLDFPSFIVLSHKVNRVKNGNPINIKDVYNFYPCENPIILLDEKGELLAIAKYNNEIIKPEKVFV